MTLLNVLNIKLFGDCAKYTDKINSGKVDLVVVKVILSNFKLNQSSLSGSKATKFFNCFGEFISSES